MGLMDQQTRNNWIRIKEALEVAGKTDCYFYKRAVVIVKGGRDPMEEDPNKM